MSRIFKPGNVYRSQQSVFIYKQKNQNGETQKW